MKALIIAAGRGTRIHSVHGDHPKCLIQFNRSESTILDHQIESLFAVGVVNIGIVVGYEKDQIIQHVLTNYRDRRRQFSFIENLAFAKTNNIYSLWLAQAWLNGESFVCLNADVVFDSRILMPAVNSLAHPILLAGDLNFDVSAGHAAALIQKTAFRNVLGASHFYTRPTRRLFGDSRSIDWAFASGPIEAALGQVHATVNASDHYPISFTLRFP
jgi:choline kinase